MDLRSISTFVQVAELGSFTKAGDRMGYSQPTISFQIKQLENELGIQLFERIGHTVHLTEDGRRALSHAQAICRQAQEMAQSAAARDEVQGEIRLAMADSLCAPLMARHFAEFHAAYPHISAMVHAAGTNDMYRMLDHNEVDIVCTMDTHIFDTSYVIAAEKRIDAHFICAAVHPLAQKASVTVHELLGEPFLLTEKGMSYRRLMDENLARENLELQPILELESPSLICQLVEENSGLSFLPDFVTEPAVRRGTVVRLPVEHFSIELWLQLLYHRDKWLSRPMEAMIGHLSQLGSLG